MLTYVRGRLSCCQGMWVVRVVVAAMLCCRWADGDFAAVAANWERVSDVEAEVCHSPRCLCSMNQSREGLVVNTFTDVS